MPHGNEAHARTTAFEWVNKPPTLYGIDAEVTEPSPSSAGTFSPPAPPGDLDPLREQAPQGTGATVGLPRDTRLVVLLAVVSTASAFLALRALGVDVLPSAPAVLGGGDKQVVLASDSSQIRERSLLAEVKRRWAGGSPAASAVAAPGTRPQPGTRTHAGQGKPKDTEKDPPPPGGGGDDDSGSNNLTLPVIGETPIPEPEPPIPVPDPGVPEAPLPEATLPEL